MGQARTSYRTGGRTLAHIQLALPIKGRVVRAAMELGFDIVRVASAGLLVEDGARAQERVRQGHMDGMPWYTEERVQAASDPQTLLPGARSIIVVALSYLPDSDAPEQPLAGRVARYARWSDYHRGMKARLHDLADALSIEADRPVRSRVFVDDGPLLERAVARRAGLGWFGKNTNILTATHGSWVFLGCLLTDLALEPDEPLLKNCGDCVRCIDACPTGAIVAPYVIDAPRCISYLTIECRGPIPRELRPLVGDWVFGCDLCQEVCPVNRDVQGPAGQELQRTGFSSLDLVPLLTMTPEEFAVRFRDTPIKRAKLVGLQRNACVALGNIGDRRAVPALGRALTHDEPLVRGHAAWALGRIGGTDAQRLLQEATEHEHDTDVREEIAAAMGQQALATP